MTLNEYLAETGQNAVAFAKVAGVHYSQIYRYINGLQRPSWPTISAIEAATGGKVGPDAWRDRAA